METAALGEALEIALEINVLEAALEIPLEIALEVEVLKVALKIALEGVFEESCCLMCFEAALIGKSTFVDFCERVGVEKCPGVTTLVLLIQMIVIKVIKASSRVTLSNSHNFRVFMMPLNHCTSLDKSLSAEMGYNM